ncbi:hypothetical protein BKH43_00700 [Helicobacter sp. 13S00401-1]|uniref:shikimate kinase n=1 Tax=Helicobacter sp. 13S00401-1 TaxID=1905758 RepID=UPI000BC6B164|nr:shikimate kinase [Helicobacter sp. 13S00401-1]PAF51788.1 hypothetical protein BKH43_00700 [Helicobacter sp. 13S00401-1]
MATPTKLHFSKENIVLIGFMGSGKSTVGRLIAEELGYTFIDSDAWIESKLDMKIKEIFAARSESYFRSLEKMFIDANHNDHSLVIATGGGMPCFNDTHALGINIYLRVPFEVIAKRLKDDGLRPLFQDEAKALELFKRREAIYERAQFVVDGSLRPVEVKDSILKLLKDSYLKSTPPKDLH